jgi:2-(1,2-epoxy-1,2-dihydrophenyl)acetyl-CoA isomerase
MSMTDLLESRDGAVVTLTLNRPDRMNAFSDDMLRAFIETLGRLGADPEVGAIVLTGMGRGFCAGGDVKAMAARTEPGFEERLESLRWKQQIPLLMRQCPKVIIAMINGTAVGAGLGLAMACDLRIAARSARFGTAFAGIGFSGDLGGTWTLTRLVGTAKARELYLLADMFDSAQAEQWGVVSKVVDDDRLLAETTALAQRFASGPLVAYGYIKRNLHAAETEPMAPVLEMEAIHQIRAAMTEDHKEATRAFVERRKPVFIGR